MLPHQSDTLSVSDACRYLSPLSQSKIVAWSEQVRKPQPKFKRQPLASIDANYSPNSPLKRLRTDSEGMDNEQSPYKSIKRTTSPVKPSGRLTRASARPETALQEPIHKDDVSRHSWLVALAVIVTDFLTEGRWCRRRLQYSTTRVLDVLDEEHANATATGIPTHGTFADGGTSSLATFQYDEPDRCLRSFRRPFPSQQGIIA